MSGKPGGHLGLREYDKQSQKAHKCEAYLENGKALWQKPKEQEYSSPFHCSNILF